MSAMSTAIKNGNIDLIINDSLVYWFLQQIFIEHYVSGTVDRVGTEKVMMFMELTF